MRKLLLLTFCLAVGASLGAYQYIISGDPAANPSSSSYSEAISLNAQVAGSGNLATALETRFRAFTESGTNATILNRLKPGFSLTIR